MLKTCKRCGKQALMMSWEDTCFSCRKEEALENIQTAIEVGDDIDTWSSDYVICPYCGSAIDARSLGYCDFPQAYTDGDHELVCDECGKTYRLTTSVSYSWETERVERDDR